MSEVQPGDKVFNILAADGKELWTVLSIDNRNDYEPLEGVLLAGNAIVIESPRGEKMMVYDWDIIKSDQEQNTEFD